MVMLLTSVMAMSQLPKLSSYTDGAPTIFLDFDGQTVQSSAWRGGNSFVCAPATFTDVQITEIFNRVSEDFRPFTINITTDSAKFLTASPATRVRVVVTPTSTWYPGVGGIAYVGSFSWGNDVPCFVFPDRVGNSVKNVAECCSHEAGHTLGLNHQSKYNASCGLIESYNSGTGSGATSWAPVMGNSYARNMTNWNNGPTYDCNANQDNLATITSASNNVTYRTDDFAETMNATTTSLNPNSFNQAGIITTETDKDAFSFTLTERTNMHIEATPNQLNSNNDGANVDLVVSLYDHTNTLIRVYNPLDKMNVIIDSTLNTGKYYVLIAGTGNNNAANYGSLGGYSISGNKGVLPIHDVALKGITSKNEHILSWKIISDEPIIKQEIETSLNGFDFKTLYVDNNGITNYTYAPTTQGTVFYRVKVTSIINQNRYSNIIALKATDTKKLFEVSTVVQQNIRVVATENYTYQLFDANARLVASGKERIGLNNINVSNLSSGMFILKMISGNNIQTERIIKQ
jgi:hypothetical protein